MEACGTDVTVRQVYQHVVEILTDNFLRLFALAHFNNICGYLPTTYTAGLTAPFSHATLQVHHRKQESPPNAAPW